MKQHFVPASYLRLFTDPTVHERQAPYLWVADFESWRVFAKSPQNVAAITDYYAVDGDDGEPNHWVEEYFSAIESSAIPAIRRIVASHRTTLLPEELDALAPFIALQFARVPAVRDRLEDFRVGIAEKMAQIMTFDQADFERSVRSAHPGRVFTEDELQKLYTFASDPKNYSISVPPSASLGDALRIAEWVELALREMHWIVLRIDDGSLFTSDRPVAALNPLAKSFFGHGLLNPQIEITFPLSPTRCLFGSWKPGNVEAGPSLSGSDLNLRTAAVAHRQCYADRKTAGEQALAFRDP